LSFSSNFDGEFFLCFGLATNNGRKQVTLDGVINNGSKLVLITDLSGVIIIGKSGLLLNATIELVVVKLVVFESGVKSGEIGSMPSKLK